MTDNRTTELLPCPFCGGEAHTYKNNLWHVACERAHNGCVTMSAFVTEAEAIAAWNARAERGTLTAEQVREAVMSADRWEKPMGNTGMTNAHLIIRDDGWQAIADELNAALCGGECEWTLKEKWPNRTGDDHVYGYETGCGARHTWWPDSLPNFCPTCGGKVKVVDV